MPDYILNSLLWYAGSSCRSLQVSFVSFCNDLTRLIVLRPPDLQKSMSTLHMGINSVSPAVAVIRLFCQCLSVPALKD